MSNNSRNYTRLDAERYVQLLGCWTFVNPTDAAKRRDQDEYKKLLINLIQVNQRRHDEIGVWETQAALNILTTL